MNRLLESLTTRPNGAPRENFFSTTIRRFTLGRPRREIGATVAVVFNDKNEILAFERSDGKGYGLPGGLVEKKDRLPRKSVERELNEEAGVVPEKLIPIYKAIGKEGGTTICLAYYVPNWHTINQDGNLRRRDTEDEGKAVWVTPQQLIDGGTAYKNYNTRVLKVMGIQIEQ